MQILIQSEPAQWHMRWKRNQKCSSKRNCSSYILRCLKKATLPSKKKKQKKQNKTKHETDNSELKPGYNTLKRLKGRSYHEPGNITRPTNGI